MPLFIEDGTKNLVIEWKGKGERIINIVLASIVMMAEPSKVTAKRRSIDIPDWIHDFPKKPDETVKDIVSRTLKEKYPADAHRATRRGPGSEYGKIKKCFERRDGF